HGVLDAMTKKGDLEARFGLVCDSPTCHRTFAMYSSREDIPPLRTEMLCPKCGETTTIDEHHVWVFYEPTKKLLLSVNRQSSGGEASSSSVAKKKRRSSSCRGLLGGQLACRS
ncbi:MAG TPA: hypothetical protein VH063_10690, partial [Gaiellaceae bacterium]|nr:hypothetical protein [Gaiellaceae bacterium]